METTFLEGVSLPGTAILGAGKVQTVSHTHGSYLPKELTPGATSGPGQLGPGSGSPTILVGISVEIHSEGLEAPCVSTVVELPHCPSLSLAGRFGMSTQSRH